MDADAEMALLLPDPRPVEGGFVIVDRGEEGAELGAQRAQILQRAVEIRADDRVEHAGVAAEIAGQFGGGAADVDEQVEKRRVGVEEREELHAGGQAREEAVERAQRLVGVVGGGEAAEDLGFEAGEDRAGALAAQRRKAAPALHQVGRGIGVGEDVLGLRGGGQGRAAGFLGEEGLGEGVDLFEAVAQGGGEIVDRVAAAEIGEAGHAFGAGGHLLGLGVLEHLQAMLEIAQGDVVRGQGRVGVGLDPALAGERFEGLKGARGAQGGIAAAHDELAGLGEELDLADAALAELDVVAGDLERSGQALVLADALAHVVGVLDGGEVEVPAPDEGPQVLEKGLARVDRAGAGAGLDVGGALPGAAEAFVVVLGGFGGDADRGGRGVGAQAQIGAEDVAVAGDFREHLHQPLGDADEAAAQFAVIVGVVAGLVEEHDQVDVGGVVELEGAHLAHGEHEHAGGFPGHVVCGDARQLAAAGLVGDEGAERGLHGAVGEAGQGVGDGVQVPGAAEIGKCCEERDPAFGLAQERGQGGDVVGAGGVEQGGEAGFGGRVEGRREPVCLALHQPGEKARAAGGAGEEVAHRAAGVPKSAAISAPRSRSWGVRRAGDPGGERAASGRLSRQRPS